MQLLSSLPVSDEIKQKFLALSFLRGETPECMLAIMITAAVNKFRSASDRLNESIHEKFMNIIRANGGRMSHSALLRRVCRTHNAASVKAIINNLQDGGLIRVEYKETIRGPLTSIYHITGAQLAT